MLSARLIIARTLYPLAPFETHPLSLDIMSTPAISMLTHGVSPTNGSRNLAPTIVPAPRVAVFLQSATSLLMKSSYSFHIGKRQVFSPAAEADASSFEQNSSLFVMRP